MHKKTKCIIGENTTKVAEEKAKSVKSLIRVDNLGETSQRAPVGGEDQINHSWELNKIGQSAKYQVR